VEVRRASEILATLDQSGALDALPFMPEMIEQCGRRFVVDRRAEKVCDTVNTTLQSRFLPNAVFLRDTERCDGSAHGGCQAECRVVWKEAWLRKVDAASPKPPSTAIEGDVAEAAAVERLKALTSANSQWVDEDGSTRYRCQATELSKASTPLSNLDPRPMFHELACGNVSAGTFTRVMVRAAVWQPAHKLGKLPWPKGPNTRSPKYERLDLQAGDWVKVKSRQDIEATLTTTGAHRGLHFDTEMAAFCGRVLQVRGRVTQIIEEPSGKMLHFASDCIKLEDAYCSGERSTGRWFCAREIYPYFRECWLERVEAPAR
jgi:hypothetical protein